MQWSDIQQDMQNRGYSDDQIAQMKSIYDTKQMQAPSAWAETGRGMMDMAQGAKQLAIYGAEQAGLMPQGSEQDYTNQVNREISQYEQGRGEFAGFDWGRLGGNFASGAAVPGWTGGKLPAQMAKGALQGGVVGGSMYSQGGVESSEKAMQAGLGLTGGAAAPVLIKPFAFAGRHMANKLGQMVKSIKNRANLSANIEAELTNNISIALQNSGFNIGALTDDVLKQIEDDVARSLKFGKNPDTQAIVRSRILKSMGFTDDAAPTRSQISRDGNEWTDERELAKLTEGRDLNTRYRNQEDKFDELINKFEGNIGGRSSDDISASIKMFDDIKGRWDASQSEVAQLYKTAEESGVRHFAHLDTFWDTVNDLVDTGYDSLVPQLKIAAKRFERYGGVVDDAVQPVGLKQVELLRRELSNLASKTKDPTQGHFLRQLIDSIDDDVAGSIDVFKPAREAARDRFKQFSGDMLESITSGKANETNFISTKIYNGKPADINKLKTTIGMDSWNDVRGRVFSRLMDVAHQGNRSAETSVFNGKMLGKELKNLGDSRLNAIFNPDEVLMLKKLAQAGEWINTAPRGSNVNYSNTGATLKNFMTQMLKSAQSSPSGIVQEVVAGLPKVRASINAANSANAALNGMPNPMMNEAQAQAFAQSLLRRVIPGTSLLLPGTLSQNRGLLD